MPVLFYNGICLDMLSQLSQERRVVRDPTGTDKECTEITLTVEGYWSEYGLGYHDPNVRAAELYQLDPVRIASYGFRKDRIGISLFRLQELLSEPRRPLLYYVGRDLCFESPQRGPNRVMAPCDVKGGPFPEVLSVGPALGDKTAKVTFRVKTYVSNCTNFLLSNRWQLFDHIDEHGHVSLTIQGRAAFRKDFLLRTGLKADDFRQWLIYPCEKWMRRVGIDVTVSADGSEVQYTVHDRETNYGTGAKSQIATVQCHVTAGNDYPIKTIQQGVEVAGKSLGQALGGLAAGGLPGLLAGLGLATGTIVANGIARNHVSGVCQITGQPGADRHYLARVAQAVVADRCNTWGVERAPVTTQLSVDWSSESAPWVEFHGAYRVGVLKMLETFYKNNETSLLNWNPTIRGTVAMPLNWSKDTPRTQLPGGANTRAEHVGRLVTQILSQDTCQGPPQPPLPGREGRLERAQNTTGVRTTGDSIYPGLSTSSGS